jgi:XapX domain-containing protein
MTVLIRREKKISSILISALVGIVLGAVFALLRLPIPAPITFAGVMGIVGVWAGFMLVERFL